MDKHYDFPSIYLEADLLSDPGGNISSPFSRSYNPLIAFLDLFSFLFG